MSSPSAESQTPKCGFIAIVGRPNVGKSTLLNHLISQKISITSRKPQTTRNNVLGIKSIVHAQMIFVDTPGIHKGQNKAINRAMNRSASSVIKDVDVVVFVVDKDNWSAEDDAVVEKIKAESAFVIVAINKVDQIEDKNVLLAHLSFLHERLPDAELVPLSALKEQNLDRLEDLIVKNLPYASFMYPEDQVTDRSMRFLAAEIIREKITRQMGAEVPYQIAVEIEAYVEENGLTRIGALILVERDGQKRMLIGDKGARLKSIGQDAREDIERLIQSKVMLNTWVKVKKGWSDDERALRSLGLDD